jgi:hypothetical protein
MIKNFDELTLEEKNKVILQVKSQDKLHLLRHNTQVEIEDDLLKVYLRRKLTLEGNND